MTIPIIRGMRISFAVLAIVSVTGPGVVHAQDGGDDDLIFRNDDDTDTTDTSSTTDISATSSSGITGGYPSAFLYRPRTLPKGSWEAGVDFGFNKDFSSVGFGSNDPANSNPGGFRFAFGITRDLLLGVRYGFALNSPAMDTGLEIKGVFGLDIGYLLKADDKKQLVPQIEFGYSVLAESVGPVAAGMLIQYDLGDKVSAFFRPALVILPGVDVGGGTVRPISIEIPASMGYQFTNHFYAQVATLLARAKVADSLSGFAITDFFPVQVDLLVTLLGSQLDVGAGFKVDLNPPDDPAVDIAVGDTLEFLAVMRYRGNL